MAVASAVLAVCAVPAGWSAVAGAAVSGLTCALLTPYLARLARNHSRGRRPDHRCGRRVATRAHVGALAALLGALAGAASGLSAVLPAFVALAAICTPLVVIDVAEHRLPNRLVFAAACVGAALLSAAAAEQHDGWPAVRAGVCALAVFGVLYALALLAPTSFGFGDVKLGTVLGGYLGWFGWPQAFCGILAGFVLGSMVAVVLLASRRATLKTAMPFGPMLIVGALCVPAFGLVPTP